MAMRPFVRSLWAGVQPTLDPSAETFWIGPMRQLGKRKGFDRCVVCALCKVTEGKYAWAACQVFLNAPPLGVAYCLTKPGLALNAAFQLSSKLSDHLFLQGKATMSTNSSQLEHQRQLGKAWQQHYFAAGLVLAVIITVECGAGAPVWRSTVSSKQCCCWGWLTTAAVERYCLPASNNWWTGSSQTQLIQPPL